MYREDVYLLSNVFEPEKLSAEIAGRFYKMRWGVEIFYRSFKQTLNQMNFVVQKGVTMPRKGIKFMGLGDMPRKFARTNLLGYEAIRIAPSQCG